jgi:hypothetical protein
MQGRGVRPLSHRNEDHSRASLLLMFNPQEGSRMTRKLTMAAAIVAFGAATIGGVGIAQAKHGADDPPQHNVRDDHGGSRVHTARHHELRHHHDHHHHHHGGRRNDDAPSHS